MIGVLLELQARTLKNRLVTRVKRLRQARYLAGSIVGFAYIIFVWRPWRAVNAFDMMRQRGIVFPGDVTTTIEAGLAALALGAALLRWLWPGAKPVLDFSETEVAFLFPAPLTRRQLIDFSLMRSQFGILFGVFMLSFFALGRIAPSFPRAFIGAWIVLASIQLHFLATTIVRSNLLTHGTSAVRRTWPVFAAVGAVVLAVGAWWLFWLRPPLASEHGHMETYAAQMVTAGPLAWILLPTRLLIHPIFAADLPAFLLALVPALGILVLNYAWVIRSDFAFEEASADRAARKAVERAARAVTGRRDGFRVRAGDRRPPFVLGPHGRPEVAILWKNLIATSRLISPRHLLILIGPAVALTIMSAQVARHGWAEVLHVFGTVFLVLAGVLVLVGPGLVRSDFRMDLRMIDLIKTYPLSGRSLVLGEVIAPVTVLSLIQVVFLTMAVPLMSGAAGIPTGGWLAIAIGAAILSAPLNLVTSLVQNAALLAFPSWHRLGMQRVRGIEAMGQQMIAGVLRLFVLALTFLPTAAIMAAAIVFGWPVFGAIIVPFAAAAAAIPAIIEGWMGIEALGMYFERFDPSKEIDVPT
ncbi:MAG: hypothetical protein HY049_09880 [Acidobacteria bacterium]|nr:hypothetical protein [Acidobacteriota bacterium]